MKCMFNIVQRQDTCEVICFKLGVMLNIPKLNKSYSSLNDVDFLSRSQGYIYRKARTYGLRSHSVVKLHEATQMFVMVGYVTVRERTVKRTCKVWLMVDYVTVRERTVKRTCKVWQIWIVSTFALLVDSFSFFICLFQKKAVPWP